MTPRFAATLLLATLFSGLGAACQNVRPWEREVLAREAMIFDADAQENVTEQHMMASREGAAGGFGSGGGGCGCN